MNRCFFTIILALGFGWAGSHNVVTAFQGGGYATILREWQTPGELGDSVRERKTLEFRRSGKWPGNEAANQYIEISADTASGISAFESEDYSTALRDLIEPAEAGNPVAQYLLGKMYDGGLGVKKDVQLAVAFFRRAAKQGYAPAQHDLAVSYGTGSGIATDLSQALTLIRKAAEQKYPPSQLRLGRAYHKGEMGLHPDIKLAKEFYLSAANRGYAKAQVNLALMYEKGEVPEDKYKNAAYWFERAAKQGDPKGQFLHGVILLQYEDVQRNLDALKWFYLARSQLNQVEGEIADEAISFLESRVLSSSQVQEAKNRAKTWQSNPEIKPIDLLVWEPD